MTIRGFTNSSSVPPLPNFSERDSSKKTEEREAHFEEQEFANRFNKADEVFAGICRYVLYNSEHSMDVSKIKQIKKAWRDLERNEPWFKPQ